MKISKQHTITIPVMLVMTVLSVMACSMSSGRTNNTPQQPAGDNKGFALVELYTSEGCSSCPPADRLMEKLQQQNAGKPVYIVAFHVDYWNHLGWKDKFSSAEFTARQRGYADRMHLESIYTPQVIVNGTSEYVGSNAGPITKAIDTALSSGAENNLTVKDSLEGGQLKVAYIVTGSTKNKTLLLALVLKSAQTNVMAGENEGRTLSHVQIVRQLVRVDLNGNGSTTIKLPADFNKEGWELIGFVQDTDNGAITAATRVN